MIQFKRGGTANWYLNKEPLADGQPGYDKDKKKIKIGDQGKSWAQLPYASGLSSEEILSSEKDAKDRRAAAMLINPLMAIFDSPAKFTYGTESPDENTIGEVYLQYYDAEPEVDYIVSTAVNKGWTYQKWKSGRARCWGTFNFKTSVQTPLGSALYQNSNTMQKISYPFTFKEIPSETATVQSPGGLVWLASTKELNSKSTSAIYSIISPDKQNNNVIYKISLQVEGEWR